MTGELNSECIWRTSRGREMMGGRLAHSLTRNTIPKKKKCEKATGMSNLRTPTAPPLALRDMCDVLVQLCQGTGWVQVGWRFLS